MRTYHCKHSGVQMGRIHSASAPKLDGGIGMDTLKQDYTERLGLNVEESARAIGVHRNTLAKLIREGRLRPVRVGRRLIIARAQLEKFLAESCDE